MCIDDNSAYCILQNVGGFEHQVTYYHDINDWLKNNYMHLFSSVHLHTAFTSAHIKYQKLHTNLHFSY